MGPALIMNAYCTITSGPPAPNLVGYVPLDAHVVDLSGGQKVGYAYCRQELSSRSLGFCEPHTCYV